MNDQTALACSGDVADFQQLSKSINQQILMENLLGDGFVTRHVLAICVIFVAPKAFIHGSPVLCTTDEASSTPFGILTSLVACKTMALLTWVTAT